MWKVLSLRKSSEIKSRRPGSHDYYDFCLVPFQPSVFTRVYFMLCVQYLYSNTSTMNKKAHLSNYFVRLVYHTYSKISHRCMKLRKHGALYAAYFTHQALISPTKAKHWLISPTKHRLISPTKHLSHPPSTGLSHPLNTCVTHQALAYLTHQALAYLTTKHWLISPPSTGLSHPLNTCVTHQALAYLTHQALAYLTTKHWLI